MNLNDEKTLAIALFGAGRQSRGRDEENKL
jgi:hypothetical protein